MDTNTITTQTTPTITATAAAAARWRERKAKRIEAKLRKAMSPAHKSAMARRVALADTRLAATGDVAGYRI